MNSILFQSLVLVGLLASCSGALAGEDGRKQLVPVKSGAVVKEVKGKVVYAYDSTGWKPVVPGKVLTAGATIRAEKRSSAVLTMGKGTLLRISPVTVVHLTGAAPEEEAGSATLANR